jgi:hypothetical protein
LLPVAVAVAAAFAAAAAVLSFAAPEAIVAASSSLSPASLSVCANTLIVKGDISSGLDARSSSAIADNASKVADIFFLTYGIFIDILPYMGCII